MLGPTESKSSQVTVHSCLLLLLERVRYVRYVRMICTHVSLFRAYYISVHST
jgi:hypothetical protein